jgi:type II secretory pathway pseudopilin PulG
MGSGKSKQLLPRQNGFTYIGLLIAVAVLSVGLMKTAEVWGLTDHRQKLAQLDWVLRQYQTAIVSYYYSGPPKARVLPKDLSVLLEDKRYLPPKRHLRCMYPNPFTGKSDWAVHQGAGGIDGIGMNAETAFGAVERSMNANLGTP